MCSAHLSTLICVYFSAKLALDVRDMRNSDTIDAATGIYSNVSISSARECFFSFFLPADFISSTNREPTLLYHSHHSVLMRSTQ